MKTFTENRLFMICRWRRYA